MNNEWGEEEERKKEEVGTQSPFPKVCDVN